MRPAFLDKVLAEMTAAGVARLVNKATGELHDVPGVEVKATRSRNHSLRFKPGGREDVAKAWQAGALALPGLAAPAAVESGEAAALRKRLAELEQRDEWLSCLEAAGVDNWSGYEHAISLRNEGE